MEDAIIYSTFQGIQKADILLFVEKYCLLPIKTGLQKVEIEKMRGGTVGRARAVTTGRRPFLPQEFLYRLLLHERTYYLFFYGIHVVDADKTSPVTPPRSRCAVVVVVVVFTLKAVPISTQYFLTSVLVQLTRTPSVVTG